VNRHRRAAYPIRRMHRDDHAGSPFGRALQDGGGPASTARSAARHALTVSERAFIDIPYYALRIRAELGHMRESAKREVAMVHFKLASSYLQRIHDLIDEAAGRLVKERHSASRDTAEHGAAADRFG